MEEVVLNKLSELLGKMVGAKAKDAPVEPVPEPTPPPEPRKISVGEIDSAELEAFVSGLVEKGIQENNQNQSLEEIPDADSYIDARIDDFLSDYDFPAPSKVDVENVHGLEEKVKDVLNDFEDELTEKIKSVVQDVDRDGIDTSAVNGLEEMIDNRVDEALDEADLLTRADFDDAFDRKVRESPNNADTALNKFFDDGMDAYCVTDALWDNNLDRRILRILQSDEGRSFIEGVMEKVLVAVVEKLGGKKEAPAPIKEEAGLIEWGPNTIDPESLKDYPNMVSIESKYGKYKIASWQCGKVIGLIANGERVGPENHGTIAQAKAFAEELERQERAGGADVKKEEPAPTPEPVAAEPPKPKLVRWKEAVTNPSWGGMEQESECGRYLLQYGSRKSEYVTMRYPGGKYKSAPEVRWKNREAFHQYTNFSSYERAVEEAERYEADHPATPAKEVVQEEKKPLIEWYGTDQPEQVWLDNKPSGSYKYRIHSLPPGSSLRTEGPDKSILLYWNMRRGCFQDHKLFATVQEAKDYAEGLEQAATAPQEKKPLVEWDGELVVKEKHSVFSRCGRFQIFVFNTNENGTYFYHKRGPNGYFNNHFPVKDIAEAVKKAEELAPTEPPYRPKS